MFKDPDVVVYILSDKYNILERRVAESLLDASLNVLAVSIHQLAFVPSCDIPVADWLFRRFGLYYPVTYPFQIGHLVALGFIIL